MYAAGRGVLCFSGRAWMSERKAEDFGRFRKRVIREGANRGHRRRWFRRPRVPPYFVRDIVGPSAGGCEKNSQGGGRICLDCEECADLSALCSGECGYDSP